MAWTSGVEQIITAPAVIKIAKAGTTPVDIGELAEGGAKLRITPQRVDLRLESGAKVERLVGYDIEVECRLASFSPGNLAEIEELENKLCDIQIVQTVDFDTTFKGRQAEVEDCYVSVDTESDFAGNAFAGITLKITKGGAVLSDVIALTNLTV